MGGNDHTAEDDRTGSPTRRTVLRNGAGALGTTLVASGLASADSERVKRVKQLTEKYRRPEAAQRVIEEYSLQVASAFSDRDRDIAETVAEVSVESVRVADSPSEETPDPGTYLSVFQREGTFTAHITRVKRLDDLVVKHVVQPETDRSYVLLKRPDGTLLNIVNRGNDLTESAVSDESVTASNCDTEIICPPGCCFDPVFSDCDLMDEYKEYCCQGVADGCFEEATGECCYPVF